MNQTPTQEERKQKNEVFGGKPEPQAQQDDAYKIPDEFIALPSGGIVYAPESPLYKKEGVYLRSMTVQDEDILNSRAYAKKGITITKLLESCITDPGIDVKQMISADRNSLLVALRVISYGAEYSADVKCEFCGYTNRDFEFNLAQLPFKRLQLNPIVEGSNQFELELPSGRKAVLRFLTGQQEEEILQIAERSQKKNLGDANLVSTRLKYSIVSIDGEKDRIKLDRVIRQMPVRDSASIHKFFEKHEPGIDMKVEFACQDCGEEARILMPLSAQFFRPY